MNPEMQPIAGRKRAGRGREREERSASLVPEAEVGAIQERWDQIKASFVDDPRAAVRQADRLVGDTVEVLNQAVARTRSRVGGRVDQDQGANTEELRRALRSYQSLIERFLG
jgi:hypothetical protein